MAGSKKDKSPVLVVGGGVIGLSAAVRLLEAGFAVEVRARERARDTVSAVAAALWYPYHARPLGRVGPGAAASWRRFVDLAEHPGTGVRLVEGVELGLAAEDVPWAVTGGPDLRDARPEELPPGEARGVAWRLPVIEMPIYLSWLEARLFELGGRLVEAPVASLAEALREHPIVVNATGLGARELAHDPELFAIRGQVVHVPRGELERVLVDDRDPAGLTYVVPREHDVVLGGVAEEGAESLDIDPAQTAAILARCTAREPRLATSPILAIRVGLRPGRSVVRLEAEHQGTSLLIHDYGHGGAGVTLSRGCADEVLELIRAYKTAHPTSSTT